MENGTPIQSEFDFGVSTEKGTTTGREFVSQDTIDETGRNKSIVTDLIANQANLNFSLSHLFGGLIKKGEYYGVGYYELKNKKYSYKSEGKIALVGFGINEAKSVKYFILKIGGKKFKINLGDYSYNNNSKVIHDGSAEGFEVKGVNIESFSIDSIQKGVQKGFSEIKPTKYFSFLLSENSIVTTLNFSDYLRSVCQEFLKELIKQL